jgi:hypothetical protein
VSISIISTQDIYYTFKMTEVYDGKY